MLKPLSELVADARRQCRTVDPEEARALLAADPVPLLIDVREPEEAVQHAVEGAINIPRGVLEMKLMAMCHNPMQPILIYCATGGRAALSAVALQAVGYRDVRVILGDCESIACTLNQGA
ncbi:rhodanese-like domain-containing protein [Aestuariirhabdus litorea]|uniref:Rhodanese-like domain-containing protein n=1 Tax=Aestuariirhabdus litorea TaxID=2528527 RepID=A0A3P3VLW5_9GAMM|nr:rhodanese-like domain-containing protein [Aestuariirhabdus litorea]RRJ83752.1 rhodanese-like domain-containing protein [Aestuariirhabdus litorea]RWW96975.1 rhodanese-like domain-containing protein [Endozoicomonadaceae bacterium GTF-13]